MASTIHFLLILLVRFFELDMIGNFNGTVSNIKLCELSECCTKFGAFIKKGKIFSLSCSTITATANLVTDELLCKCDKINCKTNEFNFKRDKFHCKGDELYCNWDEVNCKNF